MCALLLEVQRQWAVGRKRERRRERKNRRRRNREDFTVFQGGQRDRKGDMSYPKPCPIHSTAFCKCA